MRSIEQLKEQARAHERKGDWERAVQCYLQAIALTERGDGESDLSAYNRVGDLYLRLGDLEQAADYYERAADLYAEAGFGSNAIALCKKALRYLPSRSSALRRLARLSLQQGFRTDAHRYYLEYADRMQDAGEHRDAFTALEEYASSTGDIGMREALAKRFLAQGWVTEAVAELIRVYRWRVEKEGFESAEDLRSEILRLDPSASLPDRPAPTEHGGPHAGEHPQPAAMDPGALALEPPAMSAGLGDTPATGAPAPELPPITSLERQELDATLAHGLDLGAGRSDLGRGGETGSGSTGLDPAGPLNLDLSLGGDDLHLDLGWAGGGESEPSGSETDLPLLDLSLDPDDQLGRNEPGRAEPEADAGP